MSGPGEAEARQAVVETARRMSALGLSAGRSGNVSRRWGDGLLITPSGLAYEDTSADDIVFVDANGAWPQARRKPSSEWPFHKTIYDTRPDAGAVVHCHSLNATALACARQPIPAFHYMVAVAGGSEIPLAPYATFGTEELADNVGRTLARHDACLLSNHGQIALAGTLAGALELALEVEALAAQYIKARQAGEPVILDDAEMARVLELFKGYGQAS